MMNTKQDDVKKSSLNLDKVRSLEDAKVLIKQQHDQLLTERNKVDQLAIDLKRFKMFLQLQMERQNSLVGYEDYHVIDPQNHHQNDNDDSSFYDERFSQLRENCETLFKRAELLQCQLDESRRVEQRFRDQLNEAAPSTTEAPRNRTFMANLLDDDHEG